MSEWISVEDRLPEAGVSVLGLNTFNGLGRSFCEVVWYEDDGSEWGWFSRESGRWIRAAFGYWQPLPEPPK